MAQIQPGDVPKVHLGGNYAQPSCSTASMPSGNSSARALNWSGRGCSGAPAHRDQDLSAADARKEFGEIGATLIAPGSFARLADDLQLVREFVEFANKPGYRQGQILTSVAIAVREADDD
jgi:hypothetical protein